MDLQLTKEEKIYILHNRIKGIENVFKQLELFPMQPQDNIFKKQYCDHLNKVKTEYLVEIERLENIYYTT